MAYEMGDLCDADVVLAIQFGDTGWMNILQTDETGVWSSCTSRTTVEALRRTIACLTKTEPVLSHRREENFNWHTNAGVPAKFQEWARHGQA